MERECYVVMLRNDGDYDQYEEWVDRVFEDLDDAIAYIFDELGCTLISEETLFFKRRFENGSPERFYNECNIENGGQSVWIDRIVFVPNEWARSKRTEEITWSV